MSLAQTRIWGANVRNLISSEALVSGESIVKRSVIFGGAVINAGAMIEEAIVSGSGVDMQITRVDANG